MKNTNVSILEITNKNIEEFTSREDLIINFSNQFDIENNQFELLKKYSIDDISNQETFKYMKQSAENGFINLFLIKNFDEVIGFFYLVKNEQFNHTVHLTNLFIDVNHRGKGYGSIVMKLILEFVKTKTSYKNISLNLLSNNEYAKKLYEKFGFGVYDYLMFKEVI